MPGDATLHLIQQEISEVVQREKELRESYSRSASVSEGVMVTGIINGSNGSAKPPLDRAKSSPALNGHVRRFTPNPSTKGVMQRFIKSRGKLNIVAAASSKPQPQPTSAWSNLNLSLDIMEPPKPVIPAGMQPRNGFIPVEEKLRREFQEMQKRESELKLERQKSQPDLLALFESSPEPERRPLRSARSISQLSDFEYEEMSTPSLKSAKSLAELCDVANEEEQPPGSMSLIKQWETMIQKNQTRT